MFIMEPFQRIEEEQQAYARCHRYGQEHAVHVKCYYAPTSVESRLLEWRKRASKCASGNVNDTTKIVYSPGFVDDEEEEEEEERMVPKDDEEVDDNRTRFLLGLRDDDSD